MTATPRLDGWISGSFTAASITHETYRRGTGPAVLIVHEIPGITPAVVAFAERVVARGFTVVMPLVVGSVGKAPRASYIASSMAKVCVSREFTTMALRKKSPIVDWLRALARSLHNELGGPGVGAVGMCFSGGFALAMMVDDVMVAPVLSQPSLPFAIGSARGADLNLDPSDEATIRRRAEAGCKVLGLRYTGDALVGTRFDALHALLGDAFVAVEFASSAKRDHSVLTEHVQEEGVTRVLDFLDERLR